MESEKKTSWPTLISGFFCFLGSIAAGTNLSQAVSHFSGWQAAAYAIIAGLFIGCYTVIINTMVQTLAEE
ncbi:MAG: hypothetical protein M0024_03200 [Nitrospiraceae bacterium]|nr:hypothetical protein [Nitrospiraceae bacterium]